MAPQGLMILTSVWSAFEAHTTIPFDINLAKGLGFKLAITITRPFISSCGTNCWSPEAISLTYPQTFIFQQQSFSDQGCFQHYTISPILISMAAKSSTVASTSYFYFFSSFFYSFFSYFLSSAFCSFLSAFLSVFFYFFASSVVYSTFPPAFQTFSVFLSFFYFQSFFYTLAGCSTLRVAGSVITFGVSFAVVC